VRSACFTSRPTSDVISMPENAKHIADQSASTLSVSPRGTSAAGANDVADPHRTNAYAPAPMTSAAGTQTPRLPAF
jgi:hypothetical protein